jgi:hypothetical protein
MEHAVLADQRAVEVGRNQLDAGREPLRKRYDASVSSALRDSNPVHRDESTARSPSPGGWPAVE